jgi:hypothetical protein
MARTGGTGNNFLTLGSAVVSAAPLTMACWFNVANTTANHNLMNITGASSDFGIAASGATAGDPVMAFLTAAGSGSNAVTTSGYTANAWHHACGVFASTTSRTAYLNGGNSATNTTSRTPASLTRTNLKLYSTNGTTGFEAANGSIAEAAIWSIDLSAAEVAALARGVSPLRIRPGSLVAYWPLFGVASPENNFEGGSLHMSIVGTVTQAAHAPVMPACGESIDWIPYSVAASGFIPAWASGSNVLIGGAF